MNERRPIFEAARAYTRNTLDTRLPCSKARAARAHAKTSIGRALQQLASAVRSGSSSRVMLRTVARVHGTSASTTLEVLGHTVQGYLLVGTEHHMMNAQA